MSLADACLVRLAEQYEHASVLTIEATSGPIAGRAGA
jgi:hypothetical protein